MFLLEEIVIEIAMIAAVVVGVAVLASVLQASVREQVHLRRLRRDREAAESIMVSTRPQDARARSSAPLAMMVRREGGNVVREKRA